MSGIPPRDPQADMLREREQRIALRKEVADHTAAAAAELLQVTGALDILMSGRLYANDIEFQGIDGEDARREIQKALRSVRHVRRILQLIPKS